MGITDSSISLLQPLPNSNWQEIQLSTSVIRPVHYGKYKLYRNTITYEQVESYSLHFQSNQQCQGYILLYQKRLKDQYLVNSRFIDLQNINLCGCGRLATVYIEHIPIRLVQIKQIEEQDYLYVLLACLKGFQKLYKMRDYFRPHEQMVGFDCEGRLKVWFNANFSKALANTSLTETVTDLTSSYKTDIQQQMVWEIIEMIWSKASKNSNTNQYQHIFSLRPEQQHRLDFTLAKRKIRSYAIQHNIEIKKYFDSILPLIRHKNLSSQQFIAEASSVDFDGISFSPIIRKNKIIYYLSPHQVSQGDSSQSEISEVQPYRQHLEESILLHKSSIISADRMPTNTQTYQNYQVDFKKNNKSYSDHEQMYSSRNLPRIKFNYNYSIPQAFLAQPHYYSTRQSNSHLGGSKVQYTINMPLDVIAEKDKTEKQRSSILSKNNKMKYNAIFQQLNVDEELRKDLIKIKKI